MRSFTLLSLLFMFTLSSAGAPSVRADDDKPDAKPAKSSIHRESRKKIDFEDEVVEGLNRNPLDSVENLARHDRDTDGHLYRKRRDFHDLMPEQAKEMGL